MNINRGDRVTYDKGHGEAIVSDIRLREGVVEVELDSTGIWLPVDVVEGVIERPKSAHGATNPYEQAIDPATAPSTQKRAKKEELESLTLSGISEIDKLLLREQSIAIGYTQSGSPADSVNIVFSAIPSQETMNPLRQLLSAPGFVSIPLIDSHVSVEYIIIGRSSIPISEIAIALAKAWKRQGHNVKVTERIPPNKHREITI